MFSNSNQKKPFGQENGAFVVEKKRGETLAVLVQRFRQEYGIGVTPQGLPLPVTYAGRLDPMAEGQVLLLVGETCKEKDTYLGYDKVYDFTVLVGVSTDTGDVLGRIVSNTGTTKSLPVLPLGIIHKNSIENITARDVTKKITIEKEAMDAVIKKVLARETWSYPLFSSKTIAGVPLFVHAKAGTLPRDVSDQLPLQKGNILSLIYRGSTVIARDVLYKEIMRDIAVVQGDFRQEDISAYWQQWYGSDCLNGIQEKQNEVLLLHYTAVVTSGMYIRSIAEYIGEILGVPTLAYVINRTNIKPPTK